MVSLINSYAARINSGSFWCSLILSQISSSLIFFIICLKERLIYKICVLNHIKSKEDLWKDYMIVACANVSQIDIVVSEDNRTMLSENAIKAYQLVNSMFNKRNPKFIGYLEFKRLLF